MSIHVVILAQGTQKRLGAMRGPKQLLPLPACGGVPILLRTLRQLGLMGLCGPMDGHSNTTTVVSWALVQRATDRMAREGTVHARRVGQSWTWHELPDPGNSSLKGIARYLKHRHDIVSGTPLTSEHLIPIVGTPGATIVLLGDVVYSWQCLFAILHAASTYGFVGTSNLSSSSGELWGVAWSHEYSYGMMNDLDDALLRHPPFEDEYQPGQLRRWILGWRHGDVADRVQKMLRAGTYTSIDDYTMDVDLPHHISQLDAVSELARVDDANHDVTWEASHG